MAIHNIIMVITQPSHLNTGLFCPVFRCHSKTRPFANRTTLGHLNTRLVRYSDGYCIRSTNAWIFILKKYAFSLTNTALPNNEFYSLFTEFPRLVKLLLFRRKPLASKGAFINEVMKQGGKGYP